VLLLNAVETLAIDFFFVQQFCRDICLTPSSDRTGAGFLAGAVYKDLPGPGQVLHTRSNFAPTFPLLCPRNGQRTSVCCVSS